VVRGQRLGAPQHVRPAPCVTVYRGAGQQTRGHRHQVAHAAFELHPAFDEIFGKPAYLPRRHRRQARPVLEGQRHRRRRRAYPLALWQLERHRNRQAGQLGFDLAHQRVHIQILVKLSVPRQAGCL
jgi:hypothetical protein